MSLAKPLAKIQALYTPCNGSVTNQLWYVLAVSYQDNSIGWIARVKIADRQGSMSLGSRHDVAEQVPGYSPSISGSGKDSICRRQG